MSLSETSFLERIQLATVSAILSIQNFFLNILRMLLFMPSRKSFKNILIFKVGNIGDIVCALSAFSAVRTTYKEARITLLTSPGVRGAPSAAEFTKRNKYVDEIIYYYKDDVLSWSQKKKFVLTLRKNKYDLFIQFPDDWVTFGTLARNMFFAKMISSKCAIGFRLRTLLSVFRKTQINRVIKNHESEQLLYMLSSNGIDASKTSRDILVTKEEIKSVEIFINTAFPSIPKILVAICPGGKYDDKKWPIERFILVAKEIDKEYGAKFVIIGGPGDIRDAELIKEALTEKKCLVLTDKLSLAEQAVLLKRCNLLITNDTGPMHIAAAVGTSVAAIFSIRNILGTWFPYGDQHKVFYKRFLNCNYVDSSCIRRSVIEIDENRVKEGCFEILSR